MSKHTPEETDSSGEEKHIPISVRLGAKQTFALCFIAEQMARSTGYVLDELLKDVLPVFHNEGDTVSLGIAREYKGMKEKGRLRAINERDLEDRLLGRMEPGGPMGRPPKARKVR